MMKRILLASDGSRYAEDAARFVARWPHRETLGIIVVSVLYIPPQRTSSLTSDWAEQLIAQESESALGTFARIKHVFEGANVELEHVVVQGHPGESICSLAKSRACDLVVMGAKGHSMIDRILLGSTSDFVATQASCSVLVVRPRDDKSTNKPLRIAIGFDETGPSQTALEEIAEIHWGAEVQIDVVSVWHIEGMYDLPETAHMQKSATRAAKQLRDVSPDAEAHLVNCENFGEGLVTYAENSECDVMVVGETPRNFVKRILLGSTTRYVLRHASCSVWITRNKMIRGLAKKTESDSMVESR